MKKKLLQIEELKILKRNEKLLPGYCYVLNSESVASNMYFVTKRDVLRAHKLINRHISPIMDVIDYLFTPNGWIIVVLVKSEEEILDYISQSGYSSKTINRALKNKDVSIIISECMRYAISGMARISNRHNKRIGTLVKCNFSRLVFSSMRAAEEMMIIMKKEQLKLCCQRKRYRPSLKWYNVKGELREKGDVFLCSRFHGKAWVSGGTMEKCVKIIDSIYHVLQEKVEKTLSHYFPNFKPTSHTNYTQISGA